MNLAEWIEEHRDFRGRNRYGRLDTVAILVSDAIGRLGSTPYDTATLAVWNAYGDEFTLTLKWDDDTDTLTYNVVRDN